MCKQVAAHLRSPLRARSRLCFDLDNQFELLVRRKNSDVCWFTHFFHILPPQQPKCFQRTYWWSLNELRTTTQLQNRGAVATGSSRPTMTQGQNLVFLTT